jgi:6-phosphogluconolactonase
MMSAIPHRRNTVGLKAASSYIYEMTKCKTAHRSIARRSDLRPSSVDRPTRRAMLRTAGAAGLITIAPQLRARPAMTDGKKARFAYVGCRTSRDRNARGDGITVYRIEENGSWTKLQMLSPLTNPSYLAFDRSGRSLFCAHGDGTEASAFRIDPESGRLSFLNRVSTGGVNPVHLMADPSNRFLIIANHIVKDGVKSGLASLPIGTDGSLGSAVDVVAFEGAIGPHRVEQPFPKPHQVEFDLSGRFIVVPDKGCDRVVVYTLDGTGKLHAVPAASAPARETSGPRHIAFHPDNRLGYVINELDSTICAYRFDPATGAVRPFQIVSALPDTFTGNSRGSEVAVSADGRFVYASNRGHDSIAIFAIDHATGRLSPLGWVPSGGKTPRFFGLGPDGKALFVANEEGDNIVRYACDTQTGRLGDATVVAETGSPTCILFA